MKLETPPRPHGLSLLAQAVIMSMEPNLRESCDEAYRVLSASDPNEDDGTLAARAIIATAVKLTLAALAQDAWSLQEQTDWCNDHGIDRLDDKGDWYSNIPLDPHWKDVSIWLQWMQR